jgi:hypothetical protein
MGLTPEDAIEVFIDGNNNDEVIYNYDDAHWRFKRDPQSAGERIIAGYMRFFNSSFASVETDYGYDIEIELDNNALGGRGIITAWPDYAVYGFDIGVRQGRGEDIHSKVWKGNEKNPEDTSPFGTIIFRGEASEPNAVRRLVNGDFADDFYHAAGVMNTRKMPKHIWVSSRNNGVFTAWTLEPGKGIFQRHSRGRHEGVKGSGLMQIIDRPAPGDYVLSFEYQAPRHGFRIGAWGATPPERSTFNAGQITPPDGGGWTETMQYFGPTQVEVTGDEDWHSMDIPFSIGGEATDLFLCIVGDETGDTGVALRNFEINPAQ